MGLWEVYSHFYDNLNKLIPYRKMIEEIYGEIEAKNDTIMLDAGCGTGNLCRYILENSNIKIVAVDSCKSMLEIARSKLKGGDGCTLKEMDLNHSLDFDDDMFDYVTSINVLYITEKPFDFIRELYRVLKPGGKVILINPVSNVRPNKVFYEHCRLNPGNIFGNAVLMLQLLMVGLLNALIVLKGKKNEYHFIEQKTMVDTLENIGFKDITTRSAYSGQTLMITAVK